MYTIRHHPYLVQCPALYYDSVVSSVISILTRRGVRHARCLRIHAPLIQESPIEIFLPQQNAEDDPTDLMEIPSIILL